MLVVRASSAYGKSAIIKRKLKRAIIHAKLICLNYEETKECRIAWDTVNELTKAYWDTKPNEIPEPFSELETREYDV